MTSRDAILGSLRGHGLAGTAAPDIPAFERPGGSLVDHFTEAVERVAGLVIEIGSGSVTKRRRSGTVSDALHVCHPGAQAVACTRSGWMDNAVVVDDKIDACMLTNVDLFVCAADVGVGENGAVWISETGHPAAPFGASNLAVVLDRDHLVWSMHEAYRAIDPRSDYGVFVSGPSKTADIEQSLVIGAHGPKSLTILLI